MNQKAFNLLYAIKRLGMAGYRSLAREAGVSIGYISQTVKDFAEKGLVDESGLTKRGLEALAPYKVKNAIIMAAGLSSRFVPLSLEKPKGLLTVKNEVLIEREIEQLREAGIEDIVVVLGYKKEAFFYLEEKYGVRLIINPLYNVKNNIYTLYMAKDYISSSYICSSDNYFEQNPFTDYVYQSYYSAVHVTEKTSEWYMIPDAKGNVAKVVKSGEEGDIMLGHVFWDREFSAAFLKLMDEHVALGDYDDRLWEDLFADNIKALPPMHIKVYPDDVIFEFDSLDELRRFDFYYVSNTHSAIMRNIARTLNCAEQDIKGFASIKEGLTNTSFRFEVNGVRYVYRHPGEGTEAIISRKHEKAALELARSIGVDPTYLYMDENTGWKISRYVGNIRVPDYDSDADSTRVLDVMRRLHEKKLSVDWCFQPWENACDIEKLLREKGEIQAADFEALKARVHRCYEATKGDGVGMQFCHCDTYAPNWMLTDTQTILIDWEYAGNADPGCDIGTYIMDSMWDVDRATAFIREYLQDRCTDPLLFHYLAYVAILSYYWFVWAMYREACGGVMGQSLHNWYVMAMRYSKYLEKQLDNAQA